MQLHLFPRIGHNSACVCQTCSALEADEPLLITTESFNVDEDSRRWLQKYMAKIKRLSQRKINEAGETISSGRRAEKAPETGPSLRPCQQACLDACAKGVRVVEMACGTGKTQIMRELAETVSGKAQMMWHVVASVRLLACCSQDFFSLGLARDTSHSLRFLLPCLPACCWSSLARSFQISAKWE